MSATQYGGDHSGDAYDDGEDALEERSAVLATWQRELHEADTPEERRAVFREYRDVLEQDMERLEDASAVLRDHYQQLQEQDATSEEEREELRSRREDVEDLLGAIERSLKSDEIQYEQIVQDVLED